MANHQDLISVIVCTYNQQDTIGRTLDSILSQKCHLPVEIVIGEDCSTDNTLFICQQYQKQYPNKIRILANKPNKGLVRNYFDCILACRGKFIADCSGDDFWIDDQKLEQQSTILEQDEKVGIVHTDWLRYDEETGKQTYSGGESREVTLATILAPTERPAIHLCTSLYRNDWIRQAMQDYPQFFNPETYQCEDVQIAFLLARMGKVTYLDKPTLAYSCGKSTISNPDSEEKQFLFWANATRLSYDLARTFNISDEQLDTFFQDRIHKLLMHAFRSGKSSLRTQALLMQKEMNIADNRHTRFDKILTLPLIWPLTRSVRNAIKSRK